MRKEKGFTLIELLIVMAIIAILAAIAIPQLNKYRANAMLSNVQSYSKEIAKQAASLATTAGQNPACSSYSTFYIKFEDPFLIASIEDDFDPVCDKVKIYEKKPDWVDGIGFGSDKHSGYIILSLYGTHVSFDNGTGYVEVNSTYDVGDYNFGCRYYYDNATLTDVDNNTYLCHIK